MKKITKPDITNEDPKYWEKVLDSHGLGKTRLGLEDEPEETEEDIQPQFVSIQDIIEAENE